MLGVMINVFLPPFVALCLVPLVLGTSAYKSYKKGKSLQKKERADALLGSNSIQRFFTTSKIPLAQLPWSKILLIIGTFFVMLIVQLLRGSSDHPSLIGLDSCGYLAWGMFFGFFVVAYFVINYAINKLQEEERLEKGIKPTDPTPIFWSHSRCWKTTMIAATCGILSGALGIGGAVVIQPILLFLDQTPEVAHATAAFIVLFTCIGTLTQYLILGLVKLDWAITFGIGTLIGSQIAINFIFDRLRKSGKQSVMVLISAFFVCLAMFIWIPTSINALVERQANGEDIWAFRPMC
eukprot:CAMPEP_0114973142 /NCGR_PEP_ID=MMETSP0216-20121206/792_1 /TAXON_ID=223996 /ORGANISM="Protocruzia adherens, Strain Boccale" /LENGTH=293 /DNA_ID=CAMNT_0002333605 /DNA_START=429 /DNA_END=1310 /DNA_ORIENTATION=-